MDVKVITESGAIYTGQLRGGGSGVRMAPTLRSSLTKRAAVLIGLSTCAAGSALGATPTIYTEDATITGAGDVVTATRIPVQTSTGSILYYDVTTTFGVTSAGALSVLSTTIAPAASPIISNFQAGTYASPAGGYTWTDRLSGPNVGSGGTTVWGFSASGGAYPACSYPYTATWYTGPISSNPLASRITAAGITSTDYSYGVTGAIVEVCSSAANDFNINALIGASQTGNSLTIVSFTDGSGKDHSTPVAEITYTLSP
jgi:hypothetical protein